jgi:predicted transcriptional regulator
MDRERLCDSEYRLMQVIWDAEPVSSGRLVELAREALGWKKSTTYTVLRKLGDKGLVRNENAVVTALAPREAVAAAEAEGFVGRTFGGSLPMFLTAFMSGKRLDEDEAAALKALIDAHRED